MFSDKTYYMVAVLLDGTRAEVPTGEDIARAREYCQREGLAVDHYEYCALQYSQYFTQYKVPDEIISAWDADGARLGDDQVFAAQMKVFADSDHPVAKHLTSVFTKFLMGDDEPHE